MCSCKLKNNEKVIWGKNLYSKEFAIIYLQKYELYFKNLNFHCDLFRIFTWFIQNLIACLSLYLILKTVHFLSTSKKESHSKGKNATFHQSKNIRILWAMNIPERIMEHHRIACLSYWWSDVELLSWPVCPGIWARAKDVRTKQNIAKSCNF